MTAARRPWNNSRPPPFIGVAVWGTHFHKCSPLASLADQAGRAEHDRAVPAFREAFHGRGRHSGRGKYEDRRAAGVVLLVVVDCLLLLLLWLRW